VTPAGAARSQARLTLGLVLIAIGVVLTLAHAGVLNVRGLGTWWPLFLIGIGIVKLQQPLEDGQRAIGVALLFVGSVFQLMSILSFGRSWPLILIAVGALLLWQGVTPQTRPAPATTDANVLSEMALMGGLKRSVYASDFRGGYITAAMGGVELDLRQATIGELPACLDLVAFWGGIVLKVPPTWTVEASILPLMGGFECKAQTPLAQEREQRLVVRGHALMGAISITN